MSSRSEWTADGRKSCPRCSSTVGTLVFLDIDEFGVSRRRITKRDPKGVQSWCVRCRSSSSQRDHRMAA
jgi:hypothetical protein